MPELEERVFELEGLLGSCQLDLRRETNLRVEAERLLSSTRAQLEAVRLESQGWQRLFREISARQSQEVVPALMECRKERSALEVEVSRLRRRLAELEGAYAFWGGSWLWGVVPWRILHSRDKWGMIEWLIAQRIAAVQKKWALWEFCKRAGIKLLGRDVAKVTGRPAGTL